jgi:hypothetical protein
MRVSIVSATAFATDENSRLEADNAQGVDTLMGIEIVADVPSGRLAVSGSVIVLCPTETAPTGNGKVPCH